MGSGAGVGAAIAGFFFKGKEDLRVVCVVDRGIGRIGGLRARELRIAVTRVPSNLCPFLVMDSTVPARARINLVYATGVCALHIPSHSMATAMR